MSHLMYLASDRAISPHPNPHERSLSVNQALEMGLEVPAHLLAPGIDRDWEGAVHWSDRSVHIDLDSGCVEDGDYADDFALLPLYPVADVHTSLPFRLEISCRWTLDRANAILDYLRSQMEKGYQLELWSVYQGGGRPRIIRYEAEAGSFTAEDLLEISQLPTWEGCPVHHCVTIRW